MKYYRMSYEEVVHKRSFVNILLLNKTIPSYSLDKKDDGQHSETPTSGGKVTGQKFKNETELFMSLMH